MGNSKQNRIIQTFACLFCATSFTCTNLLAQPPQKIALLVGVSDYFDKDMDDLSYAENDVVAVGSELKRLGFETTVLTGEGATRAKVTSALNDLVTQASSLESDGIVFLMFSGHGQELKATDRANHVTESPFFCTRDAVPFDPARHTLRGKSAASIAQEFNLISLNRVIASLDDRSNSTRNLLVIDACRNNPAKGKSAGITGSTAVNLPKGISVFFAASNGERSWESADDTIPHGVMSHFLIQGLRGAAKNRRAQITWSRLVSYVREELDFDNGKLAGGRDRSQHPQAIINDDEIIVLNSMSTVRWNRFRGPNGTGIHPNAAIPLSWDENTNVRWKLKLPGRGASSPIVWEDKAVVTAYTGYAMDVHGDDHGDLSNLKRHLLCIDITSGELVWQQTFRSFENAEVEGNGQICQGGYATSTPTADETGIYAWLGSSGIIKLDWEGEEIWQHSWDCDRETIGFHGRIASLMICNDLLICNAGTDGHQVRAIDTLSGKLEWSFIDPALERSGATPAVTNVSGENDLLFAMNGKLSCRSSRTGEEKWSVLHASNPRGTYESPVVSSRNVIVANPNAQAIEIASAGNAGKFVWENESSLRFNRSSPVILGDQIIHSDGRYLSRVHLRKGDLLEKSRLPAGRSGALASLVVAGRYVLSIKKDGVCLLFDSANELKLVASNRLLEPEPYFLATPALLDDGILIRSDATLYYIAE